MGQLTLLLGGARSGKSSYAQKLAQQRGEKVVYLATARSLDAEMEDRIIRHRNERPAHWQTLEIPLGIGLALATRPALEGWVLLDCLTMLVTNRLLEAAPDLDQIDEPAATQAVEAEIDSLLATIQSSPAGWIVVSNEVGLGLVPPYPMGRVYRDLLGRANQRLAAAADEVFFLVAGIPVPIHSFRVL